MRVNHLALVLGTAIGLELSASLPVPGGRGRGTQCIDLGKKARNVRALETALLAEMQKDARERR
jgi:hypothetical protein